MTINLQVKNHKRRGINLPVKTHILLAETTLNICIAIALQN